MDPSDDELTPPLRPAPNADVEQPGLTESQRDWYARRLASGVPSVQTHPTPVPGDLMARTTTPDELEVLRHFRLANGDGMALAEFSVKLLSEVRELRRDLNRKIESDSADNQSALSELRTLLAKPPNGRVQGLQERVDKLERSSEKSDLEAEIRIEKLESAATYATRSAQGAIVFLILSIGAAGWWIGAKNEQLANVIDAVKAVDRKLDRLNRWPFNPKDNTP